MGDRAASKGDGTMRAAAAMAGRDGNSPVEAWPPLLSADGDGTTPDPSQHPDTLPFPAGALPPANACWSVTLYDGKTQRRSEHPIHRDLIPSPMLPDLKQNAEGSLTLHRQKDSPGKDQASNWLPAPDGLL